MQKIRWLLLPFAFLHQMLAPASAALFVNVDINVGSSFFSGYPSQDFSDFYSSLNNVSSTIVSSPPVSNSNVDLYLAYPRANFSVSEAELLRSFLLSGGRVALFGEHNGRTGTGSATTSRALQMIGSSLRFAGSQPIDAGGHHVSLPGQVVDSAFTSGVSALRYAAGDAVIGGSPIFLASDLSSPLISFERLGDGVLFAIGDTNFVDNLITGEYDNDILFANILTLSIPEPASGFLVLFSFSIVLLRRNRG